MASCAETACAAGLLRGRPEVAQRSRATEVKRQKHRATRRRWRDRSKAMPAILALQRRLATPPRQRRKLPGLSVVGHLANGPLARFAAYCAPAAPVPAWRMPKPPPRASVRGWAAVSRGVAGCRLCCSRRRYPRPDAACRTRCCAWRLGAVARTTTGACACSSSVASSVQQLHLELRSILGRLVRWCSTQRGWPFAGCCSRQPARGFTRGGVSLSGARLGPLLEAFWWHAQPLPPPSPRAPGGPPPDREGPSRICGGRCAGRGAGRRGAARARVRSGAVVPRPAAPALPHTRSRGGGAEHPLPAAAGARAAFLNSHAPPAGLT